MAGARQNSSQEAVINLSKKLDSMIDSSVEQSRLTVKLLSSIDVIQRNQVVEQLKSQTSSLDTLVSNFSKWQERQFNVLTSIDKKSGIGGLGGPGGLSSLILPDSGKLTEFFKVLISSGAKAFVALFTTLGIVGNMGDSVTEGAQKVKDSMIILLGVGDEIGIKTAFKSVLYMGVLAKSGLAELIKTLMNVSLAAMLFGDDRIVTTATNIKLAMQELLSIGADGTVTPKSALISIAAYQMVAASKLQELMDVFHESFSIKAFLGFGGNLKSNAEDLSEAVGILLRAGDGVSMGSAIRSIAFYKLVAASKLKDLMDVLMTSFGFFGGMFAGYKMRKRAKQLRQSVSILCGGTSDAWNKEHGIDDSKFSIRNAIKSSIVYGLIGKGVGELLKSLMQSFGLAGFLFGTGKIVKRAEDLRSAVIILADLPKELDRNALVKAAAVYFLIGIGIKMLFKPIIWAALLAPLVWAGTRVIAGAIRRLMKPLAELKSSGKQMIGASVYLLAISAFVGGLIFLTFMATLLSPIILVGSLVIWAMVRSFIGINNKLAKAGMDTAAIERLTFLVTAIGLLVSTAAIIISFVRTQDKTTILKNLVLFVIVSYIIVKFTIKIADMLAKSSSAEKINMFNVLASSINILSSAIAVIILSQFAKGGIRSALTVILFSIAMGIISYTAVLAVKMMSDSKIGIKDTIALGIVLTVLVGTIMAVIWIARQLHKTDIMRIVAFMFVAGIIVIGFTWLMAILGKDYKSKIGGAFALLVFAGAMLGVGYAIMQFNQMVSLKSAVKALLIIASFSYIVYKLGQNATDNLQGAAVLAVIGIAIIIFAYALGMFHASGFNIIDGITLILTTGALALITFLVGKNFKEVGMGALGFVLIAIAVGIITYVFAYWKSIKVEWEDIAMLGATIGMLGIEFFLAGKKWEIIGKGAAAMAGLGAALWVISHGMKVWMKAKASWKQVGILGATILMLGVQFYIAGKVAMTIGMGAAAMAGLGAALWVISHGMKVWMQAKASWKQVGILGATILMLGIQFAAAGAGVVFIGLGAAAMAGLGAALFVIGHGMKSWMKAKASMKQVKILGKTIAMLGFEFAAAGVGVVFIGLGAGAMAAAGGALYVISKAMSVWAKADITYKDVKILKAAISNLGMVMKAMGWSSLGIIAGSAAMALAGGALGSIVNAFAKFKRSSLKYSDVQDMKKSVIGLIGTISLVGDKEELKKHGINVEALSKGRKGMHEMTVILGYIIKFIKKWQKLHNVNKVVSSIRHFMHGFVDVFDHSKNKNIKSSTRYMATFAYNLQKMAHSADPLTKLAKNMHSIQNSMRLFKTHLNGLDLKKLTLTDSMMRSIAALSKNPEAVASIISKSINKSYEELIKALKELAVSVKPKEEEKSTMSKVGDFILDPTGLKAAYLGQTNDAKHPTPPAKDYDNTNVVGAQKVYIVNAPAGWK